MKGTPPDAQRSYQCMEKCTVLSTMFDDIHAVRRQETLTSSVVQTLAAGESKAKGVTPSLRLALVVDIKSEGVQRIPNHFL